MARTQIRNADMAIIVEGYMDVISCHQYGICNAVAPLGTAFTPEQGRLLMRSTYQVGISFDGDAAGIKATMRCLDILSDLGCTARVIQIPDQADPDEYLKKYGKEAFEALISQSQELIMYKIARYMETTNTDTITGKMQVVVQLLPDLRKMQSAVARETAIRKISVSLQVSEKAIWDELHRYNTAPAAGMPETEQRDEVQENNLSVGNIESKVEKNILRVLTERPDLLAVVEEYGGSSILSNTAADLYQDFAASIQRCGKVKSAEISQEKSQLLAELLMEETYLGDEEKVLKDSLRQLKQEQLDQEYQRLTQKLIEVQQNQKMEAAEGMQEVLQKLDLIRRAKKEYETSRREE